MITREHRIAAIARRYYERVMGADIEDYPWDGASSDTERDAREFAEDAVAALEELEGLTNQGRPPVPRSVYEILRPVMTPGGIDLWWTGYLRLDPHAQEGHAREHAQFFKATLGPRSMV